MAATAPLDTAALNGLFVVHRAITEEFSDSDVLFVHPAAHTAAATSLVHGLQAMAQFARDSIFLYRADMDDIDDDAREAAYAAHQPFADSTPSFVELQRTKFLWAAVHGVVWVIGCPGVVSNDALGRVFERMMRSLELFHLSLERVPDTHVPQLCLNYLLPVLEHWRNSYSIEFEAMPEAEFPVRAQRYFVMARQTMERVHSLGVLGSGAFTLEGHLIASDLPLPLLHVILPFALYQRMLAKSLPDDVARPAYVRRSVLHSLRKRESPAISILRADAPKSGEAALRAYLGASQQRSGASTVAIPTPPATLGSFATAAAANATDDDPLEEAGVALYLYQNVCCVALVSTTVYQSAKAQSAVRAAFVPLLEQLNPVFVSSSTRSVVSPFARPHAGVTAANAPREAFLQYDGLTKRLLTSPGVSPAEMQALSEAHRMLDEHSTLRQLLFCQSSRIIVARRVLHKTYMSCLSVSGAAATPTAQSGSQAVALSVSGSGAAGASGAGLASSFVPSSSLAVAQTSTPAPLGVIDASSMSASFSDPVQVERDAFALFELHAKFLP